MFKSASHFVARLNEVEKTTIRGATTEDRLHWLFSNKHHYEFAGSTKEAYSLFKEAVTLINVAFAEGSKTPTFPRGWAF